MSLHSPRKPGSPVSPTMTFRSLLLVGQRSSGISKSHCEARTAWALGGAPSPARTPTAKGPNLTVNGGGAGGGAILHS